MKNNFNLIVLLITSLLMNTLSFGQVNINERQVYNNNDDQGYGNNGNGAGYGYGRKKNKHKKDHCKNDDDDNRNGRKMKDRKEWDDN